MPLARVLTEDDVRRLRTGGQRLHRPRRRSVEDLVGHLTGVQAQVLSAAGMALRARTSGLTAAKVEGVRLHDRSIVLTWAMRGTLHLIAADDHGWLVPLVTDPSVANAHRRLKQEGVPADQPARAIRLIQRMLEREGPLTRAEIAERLRRHRIRTEGQAIAHLVWLAASKGVICYGPDRGREQCFVLVRDWVGEPKSVDREVALAELALRYLKAHKLAQPADLAFWSGIRLGEARRAWRSIADRLVEVQTVRGARWMLRSRQEPVPRGVVRLLPSFDEYLLGWKDREPVVAAEHWRKVNRGGGWLHPVIVADGMVVGTWTTERSSKSLRLNVLPFSRFAPPSRRAIAVEAADLARFLGTPVELAP
jgi:winged helix DNA-binding protein